MKKIIHLEAIRFIAVCLVIFHHTDGYFLYFTTTDNKLTYFVSLFLSVLCKIDVPLFFMVTGALLILKDEDIKTLYRKRVARMVTVILLFSVVQYLLAGMAGKVDGELSAGAFFRAVYSGNVIESYWFLYSYLTVLILFPFIRKMARGLTKSEFQYLFVLKVVFDIVLRLIAIYSGMAINLSLFILADNVFYVLFGYYMEHVVPEARYKNIQVWKTTAIGMFFIMLSMIATIVDYKIGGEYTQNCLGSFNPILAIMAYYMIKSVCMKYELSENVQKVIIYLGSLAFGIYLIEKLVRRQLLPLYVYLCEVTVGSLANFVYVLGTIILAVIYVSILKKIPGIKKLI